MEPPEIAQHFASLPVGREYAFSQMLSLLLCRSQLPPCQFFPRPQLGLGDFSVEDTHVESFLEAAPCVLGWVLCCSLEEERVPDRVERFVHCLEAFYSPL